MLRPSISIANLQEREIGGGGDWGLGIEHVAAAFPLVDLVIIGWIDFWAL